MERIELEKVIFNEALARCRYEIYAEIAHNEGLHYIGKVFEETSRNELSHVRELLNLLDDLGDTTLNIQESIKNEKNEATSLYPGLQSMALADNELNVARFFQQLTKIEERHKERFERILELLETDKVYQREEVILWKCRTCGYIYEGTTPPMKCPGCQSTRNCFEPEDFSV